ncbi:MAG: ABC transporter ATP-binding protein [Desulfobaccales bacterium]
MILSQTLGKDGKALAKKPAISSEATAGQISIRDVSIVYDPEGTHVVAVDSCSLEIPAGEFCVVVGPSGCGKTTLLNAIAGFHGVTSGEIYMDAELLCSAEKTAKPGADRIVVFQNGALFPWKTVLDNIIYGPLIQGKMDRKEAMAACHELLIQMGLSGISHRYPSEISGGMRRRVEIARAMMNDPKVLLLDEPFRAMDALTKTVVQKYLLDVYDVSNKTVFFITHDLDEAIFLGSRVIVVTSRPARVKKIINIEIPRPRDFRVLTSEYYRKLKEETLEAVHEEAQKAFEAGEREMA